MIVIAIIGTLAAIATPMYLNIKDKVRVTIAVSEVKPLKKRYWVITVNMVNIP